MATETTWADTMTCPFCGDPLHSPGAGFYDHINSNEACQMRHEQWTDRLRDDIRGGWSG